jgi:glycosyltransferase involved in cell wall biosynthesis
MRRKLLLFHRTLKQSGAVRQLVNLYRGLDRDRFDPFFVVEHDELLFYQRELADARIRVLGPRGPGAFQERIAALLEIIDAERPDLIQSWNHRSNRYFYRAGRIRRLPTLFGAIRNTAQARSRLRREAANQLRRRGLVVNSRAIRGELVRAGVWPGRIHVIHNGIDTEAFTPGSPEARAAARASLGIDESDFVVLSVGRIAHQKQISTTVEAVARLAKEGLPVQFVNVGLNHKPDYGEELLALAARLGCANRCRFLDPTADVERFYHLADAMVLASRHEGLSNVVLENMACGGVSVVSSAADNDAVIRHGDTGLHFPVGDAGGLAVSLREVLSMGSSDRRMMVERARKDVCERFSISHMVHAFEELYEHGRVRSRGAISRRSG